MMQQQEKGNIGYRLAEALNGTLQRRCSAYKTSRYVTHEMHIDFFTVVKNTVAVES